MLTHTTTFIIDHYSEMIYLRGDVRKETDDLKTISKYGKGGWQVSNVKGVRGGDF